MSEPEIPRRPAQQALPPSGEYKVAETLVPQMGSKKNVLSDGEIDQRKFAVLEALQADSLGHFEYRGSVDGIRYWRHEVEWELNTSPSVGGLGRRQVIDTIAAAAGAPRTQIAEKPNILARSIWHRGWKKEAQDEGKVVPD